MFRQLRRPKKICRSICNQGCHSSVCYSSAEVQDQQLIGLAPQRHYCLLLSIQTRSENRMKPWHWWLAKKQQHIQDVMRPCASATNCSTWVCCTAHRGQQTITPTWFSSGASFVNQNPNQTVILILMCFGSGLNHSFGGLGLGCSLHVIRGGESIFPNWMPGLRTGFSAHDLALLVEP